MAEATLETPAAPSAPAAVPEAPVAPSRGHEDAFGAIDALGVEMGEGAEPPAPATDGRVRGPDGKFLPKEKVPDKPVEKPKPVEAPNGEEIDPSKLKTSELAKHYHALKAKEKEWVKQREDYEKKLNTPAEWPEKKTYEEKLAEHEKAIEEYNKKVTQYETELQFTNFTKSQHYQENYVKPYNEAWLAGQKRAESLKIVERKDESENVVQQARKGTAADFDAVMSIFDDDAAAEKAEELFGPTRAAAIIHYREDVIKHQTKATAAIKEYQEKGAEWEKQRREQSEKQSKDFEGRISFFKQEHTKKHAHMFTPDSNDPREKELVEKGQQWVSRMIKGGQDMTPEERAIGISAMQLKAEHGDLWMYRANKFSKRVKELEAELAKFKSSVPGNGDGKGRETPAEEETAEQKIWKLGKER